MRTLIELQYRIPVWAITIIEYGYDDACDDHSHEAVAALLHELKSEMIAAYGDKYSHSCWQYGEEEYFSWCNDITGDGDTVVDCQVTVFSK